MTGELIIDRTAAGEGGLAFRGRCGVDEAAEAERVLSELLGTADGQVTLDLTGMTYFTSGCIGELISFADAAMSKAVSVIVLARRNVWRTLEMLGVDRFCELILVEE